MSRKPQPPPLFFELRRDFSTSLCSIERKKTYAFSAKVNLRNLGPTFTNGSLVLGTDFLDKSHKFPIIDPKWKSLIKSNLQKCIRRRLSSKAVRSAYALLSISPFEALRRTFIIILEDTLPIPALPTLAWFMMATSKGYLLSTDQVEWVLGVVYLVCEKIHYRRPFKEKLPIGVLMDNTIETQVLWSMAFRRAYGGMKGDQEMMENLGGLWYRVFTERSGREWECWAELKKLEVETIDLTSLGVFIPGKVLIPACVDQHSRPQIIPYIRNIYPNIDENDIKGAIWLCRSRLNKRPKMDDSVDYPPEKFVEVWESISTLVEEISRWVIEA